MLRIFTISVILFCNHIGMQALETCLHWEFKPNFDNTSTIDFKTLPTNSNGPTTYNLYPGEGNFASIHPSTDGHFDKVPDGNYIFSYIDNDNKKNECIINIKNAYSIHANNDTLRIKTPCEGILGSKRIKVSGNDQIAILTVKDGKPQTTYTNIHKDESSIFIIRGIENPRNNIEPSEMGTLIYTPKDIKGKKSDSFDYEINWKGHKDTATVTIIFEKQYPQMADISTDRDRATFSAKEGVPGYKFIVEGENADTKETESGTIGNLSFGSYSVYAIDQNQCESDKKSFFISKAIYPAEFFTPNGDGINDTWTILNIEEFHLFRIRIMTREGKLIKEYRNQYTPWDGTYNGQKMPCGDYWYIMDAGDTDQCFSGHFTLLRDDK